MIGYFPFRHNETKLTTNVAYFFSMNKQPKTNGYKNKEDKVVW